MLLVKSCRLLAYKIGTRCGRAFLPILAWNDEPRLEADDQGYLSVAELCGVRDARAVRGHRCVTTPSATAARCLPLEWPLVYRCALPVLCGLRVRDARVGAAQIIRVRCEVHRFAARTSVLTVLFSSIHYFTYLLPAHAYAPFPFSDHGQFYILGAYLQKPATKLLSAVRCPVPSPPSPDLSRGYPGFAFYAETRKPQTCSHGA